jgi:hypothetical protein
MSFGIKPSLFPLCVFSCAVHSEERCMKYGEGNINNRSMHTYFVRYDKSDVIY